MQVIGRWLDRVDGIKGEASFVARYEVSHWRYMVEHEVTRISRINPSNFKYVAFVEPLDNSINQLFVLEEGDHLMVYNGGLEDCYFNTDGMAFMSLVRDCKVVAMWVIENSPYDLTTDDSEEIAEATQSLIQMLTDNMGDKAQAMIDSLSSDKVLFVGQL